jgi:uncharacterized protein involved in exopolysaccharide biosynthesis
MRELAIVLFRQRRVFGYVFGLIFVIVVIYALSGTKYEAHTRVLVRRERADPPVTAQEHAPVEFARMEIMEEELNSEVELLKDEEVLRRVVEANDLSAHDWLRFLRPNEDRAVGAERAVRRLAKGLRVEPVKKTNLISVSYDSQNPKVAAHVLQSLANIYLEKHMEVHRPTGESHFFEQQTAESRRQLNEAGRQLLEFTVSHDVVSAAQQRDLALQRLSEVDASYRQAQVEMSETGRRVQVLQRQLTVMPERTTTEIRTADNPELLRALKSSLLDLELKRTGLLTKFETGHRLVQEVDQQIVQAQAAIVAEDVSPVRSETTEKNANYEWAKSQLQQAQVVLSGLEARSTATGMQLKEYRQLAQHFGKDAIRQDDLLSTEKAAEESYLLYVRKREEARMADALDERRIVNVVIARQPVVPALPIWPAWVVLMVGFIGAGVSGTGMAFVADYLDPAFRTPDEVLAYLRAPVLASLPREIKSLQSQPGFADDNPGKRPSRGVHGSWKGTA